MFFKWKDNFTIGNEAIDKQHRLFLERLHFCHTQIIENKNRQAIPSLITSLKDYVDIHFKYEEELMQKENYEHIEFHKEQHFFFMSQINNCITELEEDEDRAVESLMGFLRDWFINHILQVDKEFISQIKMADEPPVMRRKD